MQAAKIRVAELELSGFLDEKKIDLLKIEKKFKTLESLHSQLMMGGIRSLLKAADFLTPEQFDQFRAMMMQRMVAMGLRREIQKRPMEPGASPQGVMPGPHMPGAMPNQMPGQIPGMTKPHQ